MPLDQMATAGSTGENTRGVEYVSAQAVSPKFLEKLRRRRNARRLRAGLSLLSTAPGIRTRNSTRRDRSADWRRRQALRNFANSCAYTYSPRVFRPADPGGAMVREAMVPFGDRQSPDSAEVQLAAPAMNVTTRA